VGAWRLDIEANRLTCSDELLAFIGIDKSQFGATPEALEAVVHPDDIERFRSDRAKSLAEGGRLEHDFRIVRPNGEVRSLHSRGHVVRRSDGRAVEAYGVMLECQRRLIAECNHRMRNKLAKMATIVGLSRTRATTVDELTATLNGRLNALVRSHARPSGVFDESLCWIPECAPPARWPGVTHSWMTSVEFAASSVCEEHLPTCVTGRGRRRSRARPARAL
jgi:hypothetical protein